MSARAEVREQIRRLALGGKTKHVRDVAAVVLVLFDHGADQLWNEQQAAQVAADVLVTLDHQCGHRGARH